MAHVRRFLRRLTALFRARRAESDLSREISAHLRLLEDKYTALGLSAVEARHAARREFGGVDQAKEHQRDARSFRFLAGWKMDLTLGARMLIKSPGLTVIGVIALAVAIGSSAAYFEFVNDFARPTLPFAGGDRLVGIVNIDVARNRLEPRTAHEFHVWRERLRTIEELGASRPLEQNLITEDGRGEPVLTSEISASAFRVVPTAPLLGRPLLDDDERPGAPPVVVIGHDVWHARFDGDPVVVGRTVRLDDVPHLIVGVMPEEFGFPRNHRMWTPLRLETTLKHGEGPAIKIFGRLAAGASLRAAQAEIGALAATAVDAAEHQHLRPLVRPYVESLWSTPGVPMQLTFLYALNILFIGLLGICGANVATLVFARTATREAEITVRTALGASRGRIVAQLVAEALVLTSVAAVVGLVGATFVLRVVRGVWVAAQGSPMPFWWNERLGPDTIIYAALLVIAAALLVGGVPALKATGAQMQGRLKQAGASGATMRFGKLWTGVIVTQIAFTTVFLLTVAAMGWEGISGLRKTAEVAFPREQYLTARVTMAADAPPERRAKAIQEFGRRMGLEPSVANVTYGTHLPGMGQEEFRLEFPTTSPGQTRQAEAAASASGDVLWVRSARIGANYFETFNLPIVDGRAFAQNDIESGRDLAIVDESFVRLVLGGRRAVGQLVRHPPKQVGDQPGPWLEIVGVVKDASTVADKLTEQAMLYRPLTLTDAPSLSIVVHARGDASRLATPLRVAAVAADPTLRLYDVLTMDRVEETEAMTMGFFLLALSIIGAVALLLSTAGIYALISFTLSRRTREIGIRAALGASPRAIVTTILSRAFVQVGCGVVAGSLPGAVLVRMGFELTPQVGLPFTAAVTAAVAGGIVAVAMIACVVPVRRALRIQPTEALRADG